LEGEMQRERFFKSKALRNAHISISNGASSVPDPKLVLQKPGKITWLSSVGLKISDC
jgi:hypothetical protein